MNNQLEMFDETTMTTMTEEPVLDNTETWDRLEKLNKEKTVLGIYISGHPLDDYYLEVKHFCSHQLKDIDLFHSPVKSFSFSGYIQSHIEKIGKNDKPYGILFLEDYSGSKELRLFGDNYIKFRNYFMSQSLLYFSASMIKRKWDGNLSLKLNEVMLLSDVSRKLINKINFNIQLSDINKSFTESIISIIEKHPGKHHLKLSVYNKHINLNFLSKKYQVKISSNLIHDMSVVSKEYILK